MSASELSVRTRGFALRVVKLVGVLSSSKVADVLGRQLLRSATSVGANYRSAQRARSTAEFVAKLGIAEEEADESAYWLDLLAESEIVPRHRLEPLLRESSEITAMIVASIRTARKKSPR